MDVVKGKGQLSYSLQHSVVTIGNFDGVHLGHQKIIQTAIEKARTVGRTCVAYTFRPHPQMALRPNHELPLILNYDEKLEFLEQLGVDVVVEEPFTREFSMLEPDQFFKEVIQGLLNAKAVVVGYDFSFGRGRHGHLTVLEGLCQETGIELVVVPAQSFFGEVVSSSKIREQMRLGNVAVAKRLLGRPAFYRGVVVRGDGRGEGIGFPTANLCVSRGSGEKLTPPLGVYATETLYEGRLFPSVSNLGVRPTFFDAGSSLWLETHLLDSRQDLYGKEIEVRFISRIRDEKKFNTLDELKFQIAADIQARRNML